MNRLLSLSFVAAVSFAITDSCMADVVIPGGAAVVDLSDRFVLQGVMDMHTHVHKVTAHSQCNEGIRFAIEAGVAAHVPMPGCTFETACRCDV